MYGSDCFSHKSQSSQPGTRGSVVRHFFFVYYIYTIIYIYTNISYYYDYYVYIVIDINKII